MQGYFIPACIHQKRKYIFLNSFRIWSAGSRFESGVRISILGQILIYGGACIWQIQKNVLGAVARLLSVRLLLVILWNVQKMDMSTISVVLVLINLIEKQNRKPLKLGTIVSKAFRAVNLPFLPCPTSFRGFDSCGGFLPYTATIKRKG